MKKTILTFLPIVLTAPAFSFVLDDFEHGNSALYTNLQGGGPAVVNNANAFSGSFGFGGDSNSFYGRFDVATNPGFTYTAMVRATAGRAYVGIGATASSMWTAVLGFNTQEIMLQDNTNFNFVEMGNTAATITSGVWYQLGLDWALNGDMQVTLRDSTGTSLVAQTPVINTGFTTPGGLGLRTFTASSIDDIQVVPEPGSWVALGLGLVSLGVLRRRR